MPGAAENGSLSKPHKIMDISFDTLNFNSVEVITEYRMRGTFSAAVGFELADLLWIALCAVIRICLKR